MPKDKYMCQLCANHGIFDQPKRGHKQECVFKNCSCNLCSLNTQRRALDQIERHFKKTDALPTAADPICPSGSSASNAPPIPPPLPPTVQLVPTYGSLTLPTRLSLSPPPYDRRHPFTGVPPQTPSSATIPSFLPLRHHSYYHHYRHQPYGRQLVSDPGNETLVPPVTAQWRKGGKKAESDTMVAKDVGGVVEKVAAGDERKPSIFTSVEKLARSSQ